MSAAKVVGKKEGKKPHLVIATDNFLPRWDGIARFLSEVIPRLQGVFRVTVIAPDFGDVSFEGEVDIVSIPVFRRKIDDFSFARFRRRTIGRIVRDADIVFTQTIGPIGALAILAARKRRVPVVSFIHSIESRLVPMAVGPSLFRQFLFPFMHRYTRFLYNRSNVLVTPTEWVDDMLSWDGIRTTKRTVHLGVDTKKFCAGDALALRRELGFSEDDVVIGQHGRLAREKDLKTLLRAYVRLRKKYRKAKLLVVASGLESIRSMLSRHEGVTVVDAQDDVARYLRVMDVFALSSLTETTCLAALEAMSCSLPIVTTPVGFLREEVVDRRHGFVVGFGDAVEFSNRLSMLVEKPELRRQMGDAARRLVLKNHSWDKTVEDITAVLLEAMEI